MMRAIISECGKYRYLLKRPCETMMAEKSTALFVMLNPSTADAEIDDPTIRRCRAFARKWECNGLTVANLYAYRATNPKELLECGDPIGLDNDTYLENLANEYGDIVCAWGNNASPMRVKEFINIAKKTEARLWCLGVNKSGMPKHPLYVKADQPLIPYTPTL